MDAPMDAHRRRITTVGFASGGIDRRGQRRRREPMADRRGGGEQGARRNRANDRASKRGRRNDNERLGGSGNGSRAQADAAERLQRFRSCHDVAPVGLRWAELKVQKESETRAGQRVGRMSASAM